MIKSIYITALGALLFTSCSISHPNFNNSINENSTYKINKYSINGKVFFPKQSFKTNANFTDVATSATVTILTSPDEAQANIAIATGLTDANGNFTINPDSGYIFDINKIYILEANKRIGSVGNDIIALRTYINWNGSEWRSITYNSSNSSYPIYINTKTTAVTVIDNYDSNINSLDTIATVDVSSGSSVPNNIGSLSSATILDVANMINLLLIQNVDPNRFIKYQNGQYFVNKEPEHNVSILISTKNCPNCDLQNSELNNNNFSSGNLSNANLMNVNLSSTNLSSSNLTGAKLQMANLNGAITTGTTFTNADLSWATWIDGTTCGYGSIGGCSKPVVSTWIINNGETGYNGYSANVQSINEDSNFVNVNSSGIPEYNIGPWTDGNPSVAAPKNHLFKIPKNPVESTTKTSMNFLGTIGVFTNGIPMYNPLDGFSYGNGTWNRNAYVFELDGQDNCNGHPSPSDDPNTPNIFEGTYHHHFNPKCLMSQNYGNFNSTIHSPIIGWAFDGFPVYGPFGYDKNGNVKRMLSSFKIKSFLTSGQPRNSLDGVNTLPMNQWGPPVDAVVNGDSFIAGAFKEDYEYVSGLGDLDENNGHFGVTPDYPGGIYHYHITADESLTGGEYPYIIGNYYYGVPETSNNPLMNP